MTVAARTDTARCPSFPADNIWNQRVDTLPVHPYSARWVRAIGDGERLRALFSASDGIPYQVVAGSTSPASVTVEDAGQSDPGPYRLTDDAAVASDGRRLLVVDRDRCLLAELSGATRVGPGSWTAATGAVFDLGSNDLRPGGWISADEAGLPIFPGLTRFEEVQRGEIAHALRFTAPRIASDRIWPARHDGTEGDSTLLPPAGTRFRLKATVNPAAFSPRARVILTALQRYGMLLADTGPAWGLSGAPDPAWDEPSLAELEDVFGASFEAVDVSGLMIDAGSGQSLAPPPPPPPPGASGPTATAKASNMPAPTTTLEPTPTVTFTPTVGPTETSAPTRTPKPTKTLAPTSTLAPTATVTPSPTLTPTLTNTPTPTLTPTPTFTLTPSATPTFTLTPTPTPTLVPTVIPKCVPRPAVLIYATLEGDGHIRVSVASTVNRLTQTNSLKEIRALGLANAALEIGDTVIRTPGGFVKLDAGTETVHFYVQRITAGSGYSASVNVKDECGDWPTVIGNGS
ncbi:MAG: hypothetical protein U0893_27770 [Chloroflexota bacterium]